MCQDHCRTQPSHSFDEEPRNYTIESWWFLKWAHFSNNRWNEVFCTLCRNISTRESSVFWALVERFGNLCQRVGCQRRLTEMKWHHLSSSRLEVSSVTSLQSELDWAWLRDITTWVSNVVETVGTLYFCMNIRCSIWNQTLMSQLTVTTNGTRNEYILFHVYLLVINL